MGDNTIECKECNNNLNINGVFAKCGITGEAHVKHYSCEHSNGAVSTTKIAEKEIRRLFKDNSDCYGDVIVYDIISESNTEEEVLAMTEDGFIKLLKN